LLKEKLSSVIKKKEKIWGSRHGISASANNRSIITNKEKDSYRRELCGKESGALYRLLLLIFSIKGVIVYTSTTSTSRAGVLSATRDSTRKTNRNLI
jgi:hypothetical protein